MVGNKRNVEYKMKYTTEDEIRLLRQEINSLRLQLDEARVWARMMYNLALSLQIQINFEHKWRLRLMSKIDSIRTTLLEK